MLLLIMPNKSGLVITDPFFFLDSIRPIMRRRNRASLITVRLTPSVSASSSSLGIVSPTLSFRFCNNSTNLASTLSTSELVSTVLKLFFIASIFILIYSIFQRQQVFYQSGKCMTKNNLLFFLIFFGELKKGF